MPSPRVPFAWVAADTVYGVGDIERELRRAGKGYVLGVSRSCVPSWGKPPVAGTAEEIAKALRPSDWKRLSAGTGTKGPRLHDWCYLELAELDAEEFGEESRGSWTRGLLIRRHIADGDLAYFTTWCPSARRSRHWWRRRPSLGDRGWLRDRQERVRARSQRERSWHGWHRHVSFVMLAFAMMAAIRHRANRAAKKNQARCKAKAKASPSLLIRWSVQEIRRIASGSLEAHSARSRYRMVAAGDELTKPPLKEPTSN